jgi:uncharacterized integral membrane protein
MLRALLLAPFLLLLIAFALSNQQPVSLGLWPIEETLEVPLSIAVLAIAAVFFLLGAVIVWFPALRHRRRARVAQRRVTTLETKLKAQEQPDPRVKLLAGPR